MNQYNTYNISVSVQLFLSFQEQKKTVRIVTVWIEQKGMHLDHDFYIVVGGIQCRRSFQVKSHTQKIIHFQLFSYLVHKVYIL